MKVRALAAVPALCALAGCWVPLERGRQMELRIDRLEADSSDAARRLDDQRVVFKDRIAKVDAKLAEVQKKLDELNQSARRSGADLSVGLDKVKISLDDFNEAEHDANRHHPGAYKKATAALFNAVVNDDPASLRGLRELLAGGEALSVPHVRRALEGKTPKKVIVVPQRIVNVVA